MATLTIPSPDGIAPFALQRVAEIRATALAEVKRLAVQQPVDAELIHQWADLHLKAAALLAAVRRSGQAEVGVAT